VSSAHGHLKVWREGLEVAIKIKGSQGRPRREWLYADHPFTAVSEATEVHANHCEALNSAIRRYCSAYRRRQNHYAKTHSRLQRAITVQQLIHNWIKPHFSLGKKTPPAMKMGFISRPVTMLEFLTTRGYLAITSYKTSATVAQQSLDSNLVPLDNIYHERDNLPDAADIFPRMGQIAGNEQEQSNGRVAP